MKSLSVALAVVAGTLGCGPEVLEQRQTTLADLKPLVHNNEDGRDRTKTDKELNKSVIVALQGAQVSKACREIIDQAVRLFEECPTGRTQGTCCNLAFNEMEIVSGAAARVCTDNEEEELAASVIELGVGERDMACFNAQVDALGRRQ